jgi:hypothetical protein
MHVAGAAAALPESVNQAAGERKTYVYARALQLASSK